MPINKASQGRQTVDLKIAQRQLNLRFKNQELLRLALCHRSYSRTKTRRRTRLQQTTTPEAFRNVDRHVGPDNERLEFLGDAILGAIVAEYLFRRHPGETEGKLTTLRARLVSGEVLGHAGLMLNLDEFVCVQPGVDVTSTTVLGDTLEAVIGALFLDSGFAATKEWVLGWFIDLIEVVEDKNIGYDYISELRSRLMSIGRQVPTFQTIPTDAAGADICVAVIVAGIEIARAEGESRRKASHRAAKKAIHFLKKHKRSLVSRCSDMSPAGRARCKAEFRRVVGKLQRRELKHRASPSKKRR